jgi:ribonuclease P protein component
MAKQFTLGQGERLKSRKLIEQLFSEGKNFSSQPYRVYYLFSPHNHQSQFNIQFGVGVSTKSFKKAVDRNRVKRITREAYRIQKTELQDKLNANALHLNLFFIYTVKELPDFNMVKEKLAVILNRLIKIIDENISSNS